MLAYAIDLTPDDNGTVLATCPDLPLVATFGDDEADALRHASDAVQTALAAMIDDGDIIPRPKAKRRTSVRLALLTSLKVQLYWALADLLGACRGRGDARGVGAPAVLEPRVGRPPVPARPPFAARATRSRLRGARP